VGRWDARQLKFQARVDFWDGPNFRKAILLGGSVRDLGLLLSFGSGSTMFPYLARSGCELSAGVFGFRCPCLT
jgi:hypothetical protein